MICSGLVIDICATAQVFLPNKIYSYHSLTSIFVCKQKDSCAPVNISYSVYETTKYSKFQLFENVKY